MFERKIYLKNFVHSGFIDQRPFNFQDLKDYIKEDLEVELNEPEKYVMIGDQLTTDVLFGNLNKMATVWVHGFKDECHAMKDSCRELYDIEKLYDV